MVSLLQLAIYAPPKEADNRVGKPSTGLLRHADYPNISHKNVCLVTYNP